jgi:mannose-6-phosphate isomerase-like protein (cupin superfamily)
MGISEGPAGKRVEEPVKERTDTRGSLMGITSDIQVGEPVDLITEVVGLERSTGRARLMARDGQGPPRIDGYTVGAPFITEDPPHAGEVHPDGDELLYLVSGRVRVHLELAEGERDVNLGPGQALVVPRGVWHRLVLQEPYQLVHITPGPGGGHRPRGGN